VTDATEQRDRRREFQRLQRELRAGADRAVAIAWTNYRLDRRRRFRTRQAARAARRSQPTRRPKPAFATPPPPTTVLQVVDQGDADDEDLDGSDNELLDPAGVGALQQPLAAPDREVLP
jgi:hypothetical protein